MARKRQKAGGGGATGLLVAAALLAVACAGYVKWKQGAGAGEAATTAGGEQAAELESDGRLVYGGLPRAGQGAGAEADFEVLKNSAYVAGYSESRRDPLWVAYRVCHVDRYVDAPRPAFHTDTRTTAMVKETDYTRSGYQRGHMAPNAAIDRCFGKEAQFETFLMSNVCPQTAALNEKVWEHLEAREFGYAQTEEEVWVMDGPVFGDLNGGETARLASGVAVPKAFYKIMVDEQGHAGGVPRVFAVIMPQGVKGTERPEEFLTSVGEIEKETHLQFFWKLDGATRAELESKVGAMW